MFDIKKWFRGKMVASTPQPTRSSPEWVALEKAVIAHDFESLPIRLRSWCILPERDLERLKNAADRASFTAVEVNKLAILFQHYASNLVEAFAQAQQHIKDHGFDSDLHIISLVCLYQNNQFEDALAYHRQLGEAEIAAMNRGDYWQMVSIVRWAANDMNGLEDALDRALALAPPDDDAILQTALGIYIELGHQDKVDLMRARLATLPRDKRYAYALSLMALGEHAEGWRQMEARYDIDDAHRYINQGLRPYPRWQGEPLTGLRLLVSAEQGLGDTIQMARYIPMLRDLGAREIHLETQPETLSLMQYNFPDLPTVGRSWPQTPVREFDLWIGMVSLPFYLNAWGKATPGRAGYLRAPPEIIDYWKQRVKQLSPTARPKIGLAWSGQPAHRADKRRSIPFDLVSEHVQPVNAIFFALQTKVPQVLPENVIDVSEEMITLADTAALIEQMDLIITVDTSVVHIAGALAKQTWLLLPKRYEWRWGLEGESNDWYDSVKVIRQTEHANWQQVLTDVFEHRLPARFKI